MSTNQHEQPFDFQEMPGAPKLEWARASIDYVQLAWKYKFWLATGIVCGLVLGHFAYKHVGPEYQATEKILVSKRFNVPMRDEDGPDNTAGERGTHIAVIMSPLIVEMAVEQSNLAQLPSLRGSKDPVDDVLDCVQVKRTAGDDRSVDNVFDIIVKNGIRKDAVAIADAIVAAYRIRNSLPLPILGTVPLFHTGGLKRHGSPLQGALCYFHRPGSPEAEAYRSVRTAFFVCVDDGQKVIQVTSPEPGDGKSTLIANLAVAVAQSGKKVLLVDSDLRRPTQHDLFGLRQGIGVTDTLRGDLDLLTAVQSTVVDGLSVLTCGTLPPNPAELLASPSFEAMLRSAETEYDIVLVDTPPLLAVSDPCIVAQRTDAMILVLRLAKNRRTAAKRATELIQTNNVPVIGVVCNGTDAAAEGYNYRATYGSYASAPESSTPRKSAAANELVPV